MFTSAPALVLALGLSLGSPGWGQNSTAPDSPVLQFATRVATGLQSSGQKVDRENISRYFAAYPVVTDQQEARRLLSTADRILRAFLAKLQNEAAENARQAGSDVIQPTHVLRAVEQLLPRKGTPHKTAVFFPLASAREQLEIETIDLEAFASTPLPWGAMIRFAAEQSQSDALPTWSEASLPILGQAIAEYGLLVFRLGGKVARSEYARALTSPHLRQAEKAIAERAVHRQPLETQADSAQSEAKQEAVFVDVAQEARLDFRHVSSDWLARFRRFGPFAPTFSGGGVSAGDLDADSLPDLIFCGGEGCEVFRNRGDGTFEDVTAASGIGHPGAVGEARMAVIADLDNDADRDVFITYARDRDRLFENLGNGRFRDITESAGLGADGSMSGPAIVFDYDNDGLLDLYVGRFGDYLDGKAPWQAIDNQNAQPNRLYRNRGGLEFEDVTESAGVGNTGWAQALSHVDYNLDGYQDIYISNDFGRNELLENQGDGTFLRRGEDTGTDDEFHGMNVAFSDLNRDRYPDILITNIWGWIPTEPGPGEYNKLLLSAPTDAGLSYSASNALIPELDTRDTGWSWAALFFDADNDADDDLYLVNGHSDYSTFVQYRPHPTRDGDIYPINNGRETNLFFRNDGGELRVPATPTGAELGDLNSRSIALLDYDQDGDLDMAVTTFHEQARLFRNDLATADNHWLQIELVGDPDRGSSRDAIGAQVVGRSDEGAYIWRAVTGGEGYLGMSTLPLEMGLGQVTSLDLEIYWPGQERQDVSNVQANQRIRIHQGQDGFVIVPRGAQ